MATDSASWDGSPLDAESADETAPVVGVVGESVAVTADLLGEHVNVLDPSVRGAAGAVVGEDLLRPPVDGAGESGDLSHFGLRAPLPEHDEPPAGVSLVLGGEHVTKELLSVNRP